MNSYTTATEILKVFGRFVETAGLTKDDIEFFIEISETEVNGRLSKRYTVPFPTTQFPVEPVRTITRALTLHHLLMSRVAQEDPGWLDRAAAYRTQADDLITGILEGKIDLIANASSGAAVIALRTRTEDAVWSSTSTYAPTMDVRPAIDQEVDPDRIDDEEDRAR